MSIALDADYYDGVFRRSIAYRSKPRTTPWMHLWRFVSQFVRADDRVVDLGCGPGQLADVLVESGLPPTQYLGIDFSKVAVELARDRVPGARFELGCLPRAAATADAFEASVVVLCEVLEHLDDDCGVFRRLNAGQFFVATVPNFLCEGHVRAFESPQDVVDRYSAYCILSPVEWLDPRHLGFVGHVKLGVVAE